MERTILKEVMTLERIDAEGREVQEQMTAAQLAEMLRRGGGEPLKSGDVSAAGDYREALDVLRRELPKVRAAGVDFSYRVKAVPVLRPLAYLTLEDTQYFYHNFSGLVCLDIMNVYTEEERQVIRRAVRTLPMTLMAFVGSSGMSMKVLVRVRPVNMNIIQTPDDLCAFIRLAYRQMRVLYGSVIPQVITQVYEVQVQDGVRMSYDPDVLYLPEAVAAVVNPDVKVHVPQPVARDAAERELRLPVPADVQHRAYYDSLFEHIMESVRETFEQQQRDTDKESDAYLDAVVERAAELNVEESEVRARMMRLFSYKNRKRVRDQVRAHYARCHPSPSMGNAVADNMQALQQVLFGGYHFKRDVVSGALLFCERNTFGTWRRMTKEDRNTLLVEAQEAGVRANIGLVDALLNSTRVPAANPIDEYFGRLRGTWDGHDRIEALARRIPTANRLWPRWFHVWFCAMVRQWVYPDQDYANQVMPILVGPQGVGKSTFCRRLLPPPLANGYMESGDLTQEKEVLRSMSVFQLINVDEFNRYSAAEQEGIMKNYLQRTDIRLKTPYRTSFDILPRRASFIATCNPVEVLADRTGSRRYLCVLVNGVIRQQAEIDYDQLYAQAIDEIDARSAATEHVSVREVAGRCYFTKAEEGAIERNNQRFMCASVAVERFRELFEPVPPRRGRRPAGILDLSRDDLFRRIEQGLRRPLSDQERKHFNLFLRNLKRNGELAARSRDKVEYYSVRPR